MRKLFPSDEAAVLKRNMNHDPVLFTKELTAQLAESLKKYRRVRGYMNTPIPVTGDSHFGYDGYFTRFETHDRYYSTGKNSYRKVRFSARVED